MLVVKFGGAEGNDLASFAEDVASQGDIVVVHGGSAAARRLESELGITRRPYRSPSGFTGRVTDEAALRVLAMAVRGETNLETVRALQRAGRNAVGLSGLDGRTVRASPKPAIKAIVDGRMMLLRDDHSGVPVAVNVSFLRALLAQDIVPVLSPPLFGPDFDLLNADADRIASRVAADMGADALVFLTNVPGLLEDPGRPETLIRRLPSTELDAAVDRAQGGMKRKLFAVREAIHAGVRRVVIADSRWDRPVSRALDGEGTVIEP